jgi:hypothetical protein
MGGTRASTYSVVKEKVLSIKSLVDIVGEGEVKRTLLSMPLSLSRRELIRLLLVSSYCMRRNEGGKKDAVIAL